jgi:hypothetical protein
MSTIDQQFIEYIVKSLTVHPEDVTVERMLDEKGVLLSLTVNPEDLGRVIGKRGVTAQSLRTLLRALGTINNARYNLKIVNNDESHESVAAPSNYQSHESPTTPSNHQSDEPVKNLTDEPVDNGYDYSKKTREELAELDDLDI